MITFVTKRFSLLCCIGNILRQNIPSSKIMKYMIFFAQLPVAWSTGNRKRNPGIMIKLFLTGHFQEDCRWNKISSFKDFAFTRSQQ